MEIKEYLENALINESLDSFDVDGWLKRGKGIKRNRMPQLPKENFSSFLMHFARKYKIKEMTVPVSKLKPIQGEVNMEKVKNMIGKKKASKRSFFVSKDYGIADGTHGVLSLMMKDPNTMVKIYKTNVPCGKMIEILNKMKHSHNAELNESFEKIDFEWI